MKKLTLLFLSSIMMLFTACGTETRLNNPTRFDMWEYMTSPIDYKVQYRVYENGSANDYTIEYHRMFDNKYQRDGSDGLITLFLNSGTILMREPLQDVTIDRYVHLHDQNIFRGEFIRSCSLEQYYRTYVVQDSSFNNVLMVKCTSKSGVKQEFYYGYSEGLVAIYKDDGVNKIELVKVNETAL
jgi:hypothetical protein